MRRGLVVIALVLVGFWVVGCAPAGEDREVAVRVATSLPPHGWLIERVGGERVGVVVTLPGAASHATYTPTDRQVSGVLRCDVYFRAGVPFERGGWFSAIEGNGTLEVVDLRDGIVLRRMEAHRHDEEGHDHAHGHEDGNEGYEDPHTWLSPANLMVQAGTVREVLTRVDPEGAEVYAANYAALVEALGALDGELMLTLAPMRGRAFFVFHPSWGYFAERYGLRQVAIETEGKDPTDRELTGLQNQARTEGIEVVFVQPQIAGRGASAVARAIGGRVEVIDPMRADVAANLREVAGVLLSWGQKERGAADGRSE